MTHSTPNLKASLTLVFLMCCVFASQAVAPNISYDTPQVYYQGTAITPLSPTNIGGAVSTSFATVTTFAGSGTATFADGTGTAASFSSPQGVAFDVSGNLYVADVNNKRIRKITPAGVVTTFAGSGANGSADGTGTAASFRTPPGVAFDASGNLYVADYANNKIRKITPAGVVTTLAGSGTAGSADGTGTAASFYYPCGIAVDVSGNIFVADYYNHKIRKITPAGVVTTLAGSGTAAFADGTGAAASFKNPYGVAVDGSGNVYVADMGNNKIRKITSAGVVTTLAGSGTAAFADGTGTLASFNQPFGVVVDASGTVYVADSYNNKIRKITSAGVVTTVAGIGTAGSADGTGTTASFKIPCGVALSASGDLYVGDSQNNMIRKIVLGGYSVSPALPAGLSMDANTGIISGTPTTLSAATTYTVTATNNDGASTATVSIAVNGFSLSATTTAINGALNSTSSVTITPVPNTLSWTATSDQPWLGVTASGTGAGTITFTSLLANPEAISRTATVTIQMSGAPDQTITVTQSTAPPAIAYTSPQVYYQGTAISPLSPTNTAGPATGSDVVTTLAGGAAGSTNGTGTAAGFNHPTGVAVDASGNLYVADAGNNKIRKITPDGVVTTLAGSSAGAPGFADGMGTAARFSRPYGVAVDGSGNVYVTDVLNNKIRKITPAGMVTTFAGSGTAGFADGTGTAASFNGPGGVAVDGSGNVYVGDNNKIRKITPAGVVTTFAGSGYAGSADGTGTAASFNCPVGVVVDGSGNVYVADWGNHKIRKITSAGVVTTLAGSGTQGSADGTGTAARFNYPTGVAVAASGNVYVADPINNRIRKITPAGVVTTLAGSVTEGFADGTGAAARFNQPNGVAVDALGNLYVADELNERIRKIALAAYSVTPALPAGLILDGATGIISGTPTALSTATTYTVTGINNDGTSTATVSIAVNGFSLSATTSAINGALNSTSSVTITPVPNTLSWTATSDQPWLGVTASGTGAGTITFTSLLANPEAISRTATVTIQMSGAPDQTITVTQSTAPPVIAYASSQVYYQGTAISPLSPTNTAGPATGLSTVTTLAGSGTRGSVNGTGTTASFNEPHGVAVDGSGNVYVADYANNIIRKITSAGVVTTLAGSGTQGSVDGTGTAASFRSPYSVDVDASGNVYVADYGNNKIRKITPAGVVTTLAGSGSVGSADGTGAATSFSYPYGVSVDGSGNLYVADTYSHKIRKVTPAGVVTTLAGSGTAGFADGTGTAASFNYPRAVAVDASGNVYVADNDRIRKITPGGVVTTLAGSGTVAFADGTGTTASFSSPTDVSIDASGTVYVADYGNYKIRKITPAGLVTTLAGNGMNGSNDGTGTAASFNLPYGVAADGSGTVYVADYGNHKIRKITQQGGYSVAPALPAGLSLNASTGIISGTPTALSAVTTYTVSATNSNGTGTTTVSIAVNGFSLSATTSAINGVLNSTSSVTITPVPNTLSWTATSDQPWLGVTASGTGAGTITFTSLLVNPEAFSRTATVTVQMSGAPDQTITVTQSTAPPVIAYTSPQVYYKGTAISPLSPTNTAGPATVSAVVTTLAGSGTATFADGTGAAASFNRPYGVAVDASGTVYVADLFNRKIRKITSAGVVTTLAGSGSYGSANGTATVASFMDPIGVAVDGSGNVYVADAAGYTIRKITSGGVVTTLAGSGTQGSANGTGTAASFRQPRGVAIDGSGNVYVTDYNNHNIRKITPAGVVTTLAGSGTGAYADGTGTAASFKSPYGVALDASGNVYVADCGNHTIRKITSGGVVTTLAGSGTAGFADGTGTAASFSSPAGVAVDGSGNVYVAEFNNKIRKITSAGVVTTLAGSGTATFADGRGTTASFNQPNGVAVDASGNVYVADTYNNRIRKITQLAGYTVTPALPTGLSLDANTGIISGTPTALSAATTYTVSANNNDGTGTTTVSITVANPLLAVTVPTLTLSKEYDGTATATVTAGTLSNVAPADAGNVIVSATATYDNANVGSGKTITVTYVLSGSAAGNYTAPLPYVVTNGVIGAKTLNITGVSAGNKVYDGTTVATLSGGSLTGVLNSDDVTIVPGTGAFANASIGTGKTVTATGYGLTGTAAGNYTLSAQPTGLTADITVATLIVSDIDSNSGAAPDQLANTDITIASTGEYTINEDAVVHSITVAPKGKLTLADGKTLTTQLTLQSNASGTGTYVDKNTGSNLSEISATVQQYLTSGRNWYVAMPITSANVEALSTATSVVWWNEPLGVWSTVSAASAINPLVGYISTTTKTEGPITFNGTLNNGEKSVTLTRTEGAIKKGFNLIGNPYPSYLNPCALITSSTKMEPTIWFRTKSTSYTFETINTSSGVGTNNSGKGVTTGFVPPMQAFWVRVADNGGSNVSETLTFTNAMRSHDGSNGTNLLKAPGLNESKILRLQVSNGINSDEAILYFNPKASNDYDSYDSYKMNNGDKAIPEIYTQVDNSELVINGMSSYILDREIPLGFRPGKPGDFSIKAIAFQNFASDVRVVLKDSKLESETDISDGSAYNFNTTDDLATTTRFKVIFRSKSITTGIDETNDRSVVVCKNENNKIVIYYTGNLYSNNLVAVYNAIGQKVAARKMTGSTTVLNNSLPAGVYFVMVNVGGKNATHKVILK